MDYGKAVILGIIQGLTEFLPVSSSGHLVLFQNLFGLTEPQLLFDVAVHVGTLVAVVIMFRHQIVQAVDGGLSIAGWAVKKALLRPVAWPAGPNTSLALWIMVGSVPTGLIGLGFHKVSHVIFASATLAGAMLLVTGTLLWVTRWITPGTKTIRDMRTADALTVGVAQGLAILPGISRSGSTIATAMILKVDRVTAARYSFVLSVPAILGALVLEVAGAGAATRPGIGILLTGGLVAAVTGYGALVVLMRVLNQGRLHWFAPYCWAVGLLVLGLAVF